MSPKVKAAKKTPARKSAGRGTSAIAAAWKSRITKSGTADPKALVPNPRNWRRHPALQQKGVRTVLDRVGWVQPVLVNERTGHLVDGHLRVMLAVERGEKSIPVSFVDLSTEEEALVLATLDPLAGMAEGHGAALDELLATVKRTKGSALDDLLREVAAELPSAKFVEFKAGANKPPMIECPKCHHKFPA